jgi:hypothetical protein
MDQGFPVAAPEDCHSYPFIFTHHFPDGPIVGNQKTNRFASPYTKRSFKGSCHWLPVDSLHRIANTFLRDSVRKDLPNDLDRIDIRPEKGIVKFVYVDHYWSLQLDGTTGKLLSIEKRNSDLIENIHDGSILDKMWGTGEMAKIIYTVGSGICLTLLIMSGFWLWFGPKRLRQSKRKAEIKKAKVL